VIKIYINKSFAEEKKYIIETLLGEFLGIDFEIFFFEKKAYLLKIENGNEIEIIDSFFSKIPSNNSFLERKNIPDKIVFGKNKFCVEDDIPIIFGNEKIEVNKNKILCGIDIFSSSFFMLTRWEEYINKARDKHDRFPGKESVAYKFSFLQRPVVNEYIEMLWNMLVQLGNEQKRKKRTFTPYITHDIDYILKWISVRSFLRSLIGDVYLRRNFKLLFKNVLKYFKVRKRILKDEFDTFDYLMDLVEKYDLKSYFFFMVGGTSGFDNGYSLSHPYFEEIIQKIKNRGHYIGIHPSFNTYKNYEQLKKEIEILKNLIKSPISFGRQHYLRFEVPITWQIWNDLGMKWDSSMYYDDQYGFRTGTCYEYSVFNFLTRKKLNLKENTLVYMDSTLVDKGMSENEIKGKIFDLIEKVKKYNGNFTFLWHNSNLTSHFWKKFIPVYENVVKNLNIEL